MPLPLFYDQEKPDNLQNLTIYRSSAGSGKTFTLVKDYLKIVLRNPDEYSQILAITFTNKATEEMKQKILAELAQISLNKPTKIRSAIESDFSDEGIKMEISSRADIALLNILHNYGRFGVSTLDHFFSKVVRSFARELDLPMKYDIDVDEARAVDAAVEKLYETIPNDTSLKSWLEDFAFSKMDADRGWDIDRNLKKLGQELFKENFRKGIGKRTVSLKSFNGYVKKLSKTRAAFENELKASAQKALDLIDQHGLQTTDFSGGSRSWANTFNKILQLDFDFTGTFIKTITGEKSPYAKSSPDIQKIEEVMQAGLQDMGSHILTYYQNHHRSYNAAVLLLKNIYAYGILSFIDDKLIEYRADNNLVLLSDHAFLLNEVIDSSDAPIIYEKIGSRFKHILIDEFQDTSLYQWQNILPLVSNVLENFGQVLIVGDVKQSIYRWRGGDMKLLISGIRQDLHAFKNQTQEKELDKNYRSAENIVLFNNAFFETASRLLSQNSNLPPNDTLIADTYRYLKQNPAIKEEGYIEIRLFSDEEDVTWMQKAKERTIQVVEHNLNLGYSPGDFMILVDKWTRGYDIAEYLMQNGYKVITDKSLKVESSAMVQLLINAIRWLQNRDDRLAQANLLYLFHLLGDKEIKNTDALFSDIHHQDELFKKNMPDYFLNNLKVFLRLPLYELVETLIQTFNMGGHTNNFVIRFLEICLEQSAKGRNDLSSFLQWWDESKDEQVIVTPEIDDAFEILTVHKAKGLQKPIVIMPFASFEMGTKTSTIFWTSKLRKEEEDFKILPLPFEKKLADSDFEEAYRAEYLEGLLDRLNMTYVAFTRAEQRLYAFSQSAKKEAEGNYLHNLMYGVFADPSFGYGNRWDPMETVFVWGDKDKKPSGVKPEGKIAEVLDIQKSKGATDTISIKSESGRFFMLFDNTKSDKIKQGIVLHRVFESLETRAGLESVVAGLVPEGIVAENQVKSIIEITNRLFENGQVRSWFDGSWRVFTERAIISPRGIRRPDRVMIKEDQVIVVDYKSGARDQAHDRQLREYRDLLMQMGYKNIRMFLMYFNEVGIVEVK